MRNNVPGAEHPDASPSVLQALSILECLDDSHPRQTLSEIGRRLSLPKASVFRHLAALEARGYVSRDAGSGCYSLGVQLLRLSRRYAAQNGLLAAGARHLTELAQTTGETTHLSVLAGREVVYVDVAAGHQAIRAVVDRGDRLPAHGVASGKVILAHSPPRVVTEFLAKGLPSLTPRTISSPNRFVAELEKVRALGYATCIGEWLDDVSAIAAPVFSDAETVVGAIGLAGPRLRLGSKLLAHLGTAVTAQAKRLSEELGAGERSGTRAA